MTLRRVDPGKRIVDQLGRDALRVVDGGRAGRRVDELIILHIQAVGAIGEALFAVGDDLVIRARRPLDEQVAADRRDPAIDNIDRKARRARAAAGGGGRVRAIIDPAIDDRCDGGS